MSDLFLKLPNDFLKRYEKYRASFEVSQSEKEEKKTDEIELKNDLPVVIYDTSTGLGSVLNGKDFKFKYNSKEFRLFRELHNNINTMVKRYDVVVAIELYEDGDKEKPERRSLDTEAISRTANKIREKTGLTTDQLVNNDGNLVLKAKKG